MSAIFTISLDFELHWGGFEKWPIGRYQQYFLNTRTAIPEMLSLFSRYEVHVTWAAVGMLFYDTRKELELNLPKLKPGYINEKLSPYRYIAEQGIGRDEREDPFHFARSLIEKIIATPFQELGTHTFSHFYCNEKGQNIQEFREDLKAAQRAAAMFDKRLTSLVFPRNQFNDNYLKVCYEEGITAVRANPVDWFWNIQSTQNESIFKRLNRGMDAYFPIGSKNAYKPSAIPVHEGYPVCLPASRLLRPYHPRELFLNKLKVSRIQSEMFRAAKNNEVYHLWWHPHNFGKHPRQSLAALEEILKHYKVCKKKYDMLSFSMAELASIIRNEK